MAADATRVAALLKVALRAPASVPNLAARDLDLLIRAARRVRLLGRLAADLQAAGVFDRLPPVARDQLHGTLVYAEARARLARWELDRIAWALEDAPPSRIVAMKGCAYLLLDLPMAASRIMADVDLMLPEAELEIVERRLNQRGWRTKPLSPYDDHYYRRWTHELPPLAHVERQVEIDLHHNLLPVTARPKPPAEPMLEAAAAVPGSPYRVLDGPDMVLHAMVHLFYSDEMADKLRDLVDIADLLEHFAGADTRFWKCLVDRARRLGLERPAFYGLRYARQLLDFPVPESAVIATTTWGPPAPIRLLMDRLTINALFPQHPDRQPPVGVAASRLLLYARSHWIRMPPWLLVYHLGYKFYVTRFRRRSHSA
jgi:hypothetical protein